MGGGLVPAWEDGFAPAWEAWEGVSMKRRCD